MTTVRVPFADLSPQWRAIESHVMPELKKLFEKSAFCLGPAVEKFEREFAAYLGADHAIGVNSGTSALHLALVAANIGPGDKVILPTNTFIATLWAVLYVGASPILCDVDSSTANINITDAENRMEGGVKAVIPVHLYGQPADMDAVQSLAIKHKLAVIEDAAQAHGAKFHNRHVGTFGKLGCFSFYPGKNLGAAGEGGVIVTDDSAIADRLRALRNHAQEERYIHTEIGFNYRMEGIQGLVLSHKLRYLDHWNSERRLLAGYYSERLADLPVKLPRIVNEDHVFHLFVIRTSQRDALRDYLTSKGVQTGLHYPVPLHRQPCLHHQDIDRDSFPITDEYANDGISLPIYAGMTEKQLDIVVEEIRVFFNTHI